MKIKLRHFARMMRRALQEPWKMRTAKINLWLWSGAALIAAVNIPMNLMLQPAWMYFWLVINTATLLFDVTCLKWAVQGYFWRKAHDEAEAQERKVSEAFYAMVIEEYKRR